MRSVAARPTALWNCKVGLWAAADIVFGQANRDPESVLGTENTAHLRARAQDFKAVRVGPTGPDGAS